MRPGGLRSRSCRRARYTVQADLTGFSVFRQRAKLAVGAEILDCRRGWPSAPRRSSSASAKRTYRFSIAIRPWRRWSTSGRSRTCRSTAATSSSSRCSRRERRPRHKGRRARSAATSRLASTARARTSTTTCSTAFTTSTPSSARRRCARRSTRFRSSRSPPPTTTPRSAGTRGGQVNVLTRSGANRFAARRTSSSATARSTRSNHFAPETSPRPITAGISSAARSAARSSADRTFFFADYERTRLREGITRVTNVPTAAERSGDFSQSLFPRAGRSSVPAAAARADAFPSFFIHPVGAAIAALYPRAEPRRARSRISSRPRRCATTCDQMDGKIDHALDRGRQR